MPAPAMMRSGAASFQRIAAAMRSPEPPLTTPFTMFRRFISASTAWRCSSPVLTPGFLPLAGLAMSGMASSAG